MISNEQYERMQQFLDANMTLEEMEAFEKELDANPEIRQQLDFEQALRDTFILNKTKTTGPKEVVAIKSTNAKAPIISIKRKRWIVILAAASVLAAVFTIFFYKSDNKPEPTIVQEKETKITKKPDSTQIAINKPNDSTKTISLASLFKQYFTVDEIPETYPMYLAEALTGYENGEYKNLQNLNLSDIPESRGADEKQAILELGHYYKGIALLQTGNSKQAITNMTWLEKNCTNKELKAKGEWYLALAYLKSDNVTEAAKVIKKIAGKNTYSSYKDKAKNILKVLEE